MTNFTAKQKHHFSGFQLALSQGNERLFFFLFLLFGCLAIVPGALSAQSVAINEVMASNNSTLADEDGDYEDWIELYNYGTTPVNLLGYGLSDSYSSPLKWIFPDVTIQPGEYLLVWASGKDRRPSAGETAYINALLREVYTDIPGVFVHNLTEHPKFPEHPDSVNLMANGFEAPINVGDHYGQRVQGYIKAPQTGEYTFWISSDDFSELYLSTSQEPQNAVMIAQVPGWNQPREWDKYPEQKSNPVHLQAGQYYYIMALMKEHEGGDNLAVGWQFPDQTMDRPISKQYTHWYSSELHTNFRISEEGEEVILSAPGGTIISELQPTHIPTDISWGRVPDGTGEWNFFSEPTPGQANTTEAYSEILTPPQFSVPGGFHAQDFELAITHPDNDVQIVYTLDGSHPDPHNTSGTTYPYKNQYPYSPDDPIGDTLYYTFQSHLYDTSITIYDRSPEPDKLTQIATTWEKNPWYFPDTPVRKGTIVRAKAFKEGALPSPVATHSFFVTPDGENPYTVPIFSFSMQEDALFDYYNGIFVAGSIFDNWRLNNSSGYPSGSSPANFRIRGPQQERIAHLEFFETNTTGAVLMQDMGLRVHGGWSKVYPLKSMRLYARNRYGLSTFDHPFFPTLPDNSFKRLILRNTGNDYWHTYMRDAVYQKMVAHLDLETQAYQPSVVFINGEYWGMMNIRERYDKHYIGRRYDVDPENIDMLENYGYPGTGFTYHYHQLRRFIEDHNLAEASHYEYITTQIDLSNFLDYQIANIFVANTDWPGNNNKYWRVRTPGYLDGAPKGHDGRWRWLLLDTDFGLGMMESYSHNTLAFATATDSPHWANPEWATLFLRKLLENESFRTRFIIRFADLLNTTFLSERLSAGVMEAKQLIEPEMPEHIHRWKAPEGTTNQWSNNVNVIFDFIEHRPTHQRNHIMSHFDIPAQLTLTVDVSNPEHGYIRVNTIGISPQTAGVEQNPYPWTGIYFSGIPMEAEAIPMAGYSFSHWEGDLESDKAKVEFTPSGDFALTAHFVPAGDEPTDTLLHYWHFNNLSGAATSIASDYSLPESGTINYPGSGDGYMDSRTHRAEDPVSNMNLFMGQQPNQGAVLRARNPSHTRELIIHAPTTGFDKIRVAYATTRTTNGAKRQSLHYSPDGGITWKPTSQGYEAPLLPQWELKEFNLSGMQGVANNPDLLLKIVFWGESAMGTSGNNRFDNLSVSGTTYFANVEETDYAQPWVALYPNPARDHIILDIDPTHFREGNLEMFTIDGRPVISKRITSAQTTLSIADLPKGIYIVSFTNALHRVSRRLVKQ